MKQWLLVFQLFNQLIFDIIYQEKLKNIVRNVKCKVLLLFSVFYAYWIVGHKMRHLKI